MKTKKARVAKHKAGSGNNPRQNPKPFLDQSVCSAMELTDQSAIKSEHEKSSARDGDDKSFSLGERVLASHNHILYEAKVIEIDHKNNEQKFHVHYRGWKDKYNEWVTIDRLLKHNEENLKLLEKIYKQHEASKQKKTTSHLKARHASGKGKKRKFGTVLKTEIADWGKAVDIRVPQSLRKQLSQDCELVAQMGELVNLPCSPNVEEILHMYIDNRLKNGEELVDSLIEIMKGLHNYFDKALPAMLLYKNERQQYQQFTANQVPPSKVYGAEHLLRLLVKLPELLCNANIEEATLGELKDKLQDFLTFLQEKQSTFFVSTTSKFAETSTEDNK
ncbi:hypothetical protein QQ045_019522 [Rhodiola kirilowii]